MKNPCVLCLLTAILCASSWSCGSRREAKIRADAPQKIVWAWERAEDLRFLDAREFGVAFLAQTLILQSDDVVFRPRRQPLDLPDNIYLIAVTRIETYKRADARAQFSDAQKDKIVALVGKTLASPNVKAVQIDFDAAVSERDFYKNLLVNLRENLPRDVPLSMTALASWCLNEKAWFAGAPVDEAVPMTFELGAQDTAVRDFLSNGSDWREPMCRASYGVSVDENIDMNFRPNRRVFYFKSSAWRKSDLEKLNR